MLVTEDSFGDVLLELSKQPRLITDSETNGLHTWHGARLIGISVATPNATREQCYYFPFRHKPGHNLQPWMLRELLKLLQRKPLTFWNAKFDLHMYYADGMGEPKCPVEDVMLLLHLVDENQWTNGGSYELKYAAQRYIDPNALAAQLRLQTILMDRGFSKDQMWELWPEEVDEYASDDCFYTEGLRTLLVEAAREWELERIWAEINQYVLITGHPAHFEGCGFRVDLDRCQQYLEESHRIASQMEYEIFELSDEWVTNPRSNPQLQSWLKLPSTSEEHLDDVWYALTEKQRQGVTLLQDYRKWKKAHGSYYKPLLANCDSASCYHPNIILHGTVTGRPANRGSPNVLAIPRESSIYKVKDCIVARPGHTLVSADYAQAELRLAAHYTGDEHLVKCFQEGKSPHRLLQAQLYASGIDPEKVDYTRVKNVSFATAYGTGARTLAGQLKSTEEFAQQVLDAAHAQHPFYRPAIKQAEDTARRMGYIRMWSGRVRHFNTMSNPWPHLHKAWPNIIQGGIGEMMRIAICRLRERLGDEVHMLLQVYDQILFDVPTEWVDEVAPIIREEMIRDFPFKVPFEVEISIGERWGKLEKLDLNVQTTA